MLEHEKEYFKHVDRSPQDLQIEAVPEHQAQPTSAAADQRCWLDLEPCSGFAAPLLSKQGGLPHFRKVQKFRSFTLKQTGWKLLDSEQKYGRVQIGTKVYKLVYHRPMQGDIKTVTIKRDPAGRLWICFSVVERFVAQNEVSAGQIGGFDFGLKCFLTNDEGQQIASPWFYRDDLPRLRSIQRQVSKKVKGSANR